MLVNFLWAILAFVLSLSAGLPKRYSPLAAILPKINPSSLPVPFLLISVCLKSCAVALEELLTSNSKSTFTLPLLNRKAKVKIGHVSE